MPEKYEEAPVNVKALEQRLRNRVENATFNRARRELSNLAVLKALSELRDTNGDPIFAVKGGVAMELEFGFSARTTADLDVGFRAQVNELADLVADALAPGWGGFEFRISKPLAPIWETGAFGGEVKVTYLSRDWGTVKLEVGPAEGASGMGVRSVENAAFNPDEVGIESIPSVPAVEKRYMIAQKLHACTDHSRSERPNERARDVPDVIVLWESLADELRRDVRGACVEIFALRDKQTWPPTVVVVDGWASDYANAINGTEFEIEDLKAAVERINTIIDEIEAAAVERSGVSAKR
jgi:hypothetical protein